MKRQLDNSAGEDLDLRQILLEEGDVPLRERAGFFRAFLQGLEKKGCLHYRRCIDSAADREILVREPPRGEARRMLMFGSNNYLGLANHPYVKKQTAAAIRKFGAGLGGPPLLNGYTTLHRELEERISSLKRTEDALLFSSGYSANLGLISGITHPGDRLLYDAYSHASLWDGIRLAGVPAAPFPHNDMDRLEKLLARQRRLTRGDLFVSVEGVYSMDGDAAPLDRILALCKSHDATLILDDAHGTGVMGRRGTGTAEHFQVEGEIPLTMGTFSKTFAATGGFVAGPRPLIDYLRYFARSYMFSASLPPTVIATVLAGLEVLEREPWRVTRLKQNVAYTAHRLRALGFEVNPAAAIVPICTPPGMNIRAAARMFHERGIFLNAIEYPAVQVSQQRFRVSLMATHTRDDIDRLMAAVEEVWSRHASPASTEGAA